jgi:hypothetical protein
MTGKEPMNTQPTQSNDDPLPLKNEHIKKIKRLSRNIREGEITIAISHGVVTQIRHSLHYNYEQSQQTGEATQ